MLNFFEKPEDLLANGSANPGMLVTQMYRGPFPLVKDAITDDGKPGPRENVELANVIINKVTVAADEYAVVTICALKDGKPHYAIYCGDNQVNGKYEFDGKTLAKKIRDEGKVPMGIANMLEASEWVRKVPVQAQCNFFKMLKRSSRYCPHTATVLSELTKEDLEELATELKDWSMGKVSGAAATATGITALSEEDKVIIDAAFVQHVLIAGERGAGKTYLARQLAEAMDCVYLEMQMHPSMESWEFRAHDRAVGGKVYTVLGKLAEAVYWIQKGKRVVLIMDELLNMNPVHTTAINSALTLTANDTYCIETGRITDVGDGVGLLETTEVPAEMLWVVATSNVGSRYNLDKIAPSVRARFLIVLMNTDPARTEKIVEKLLTKYEMPFSLVKPFSNFIKAVLQAVKDNQLDEEATTRLVANVLRAVHLKAVRDGKKSKSNAEWLKAVKKQVLLEVAQVVNFEIGNYDPDQYTKYVAIVNAAFV